MSSITASANAERTNRWLLIGAVVLAIATGVLVFAAVANFGSDDDKAASAVDEGDQPVVVAAQDIAPNTKITDNMVEVRSVAPESLVTGALGETSVVVGEVAQVQILRGEQVSANRLVGTTSTLEDDATCIACKIPAGKRAFSINVSESTSVAGLVVPGDRVDVYGIFTEEFGEQELTRVDLLLQNLEVLAFAQVELENINDPTASMTPGAEVTPIATDRSAGVLGGRPNDPEPNPGAGTVTLALTPGEVALLAAAQNRGELTLAMRALGDESPIELTETNMDEFGFLGPLPPAR